MPYESKAQERFFNANKEELQKHGVNVNEWNKASAGKNLPQHLAYGGHVFTGTEHDSHFHFAPKEEGKGKEFRVAKKGLKPETMKAYQALCGGGKVQKLSGSSGDPSDSEVHDDPSQDASTSSGEPKAAPPGVINVGTQAPAPAAPEPMPQGAGQPVEPPGQNYQGTRTPEGQPVAVANPAGGKAMVNPATQPMTTIPNQPVAPGAALAPATATTPLPPAQNNGADFMKEWGQLQNQPNAPVPLQPVVGVTPQQKAAAAAEQTGNTQLANALAQEGQDKAAAQHNYQQMAEQRFQDQQAAEKTITGNIQKAQQDYADSKIDPTQYWHQGSVGHQAFRQIGSILGILVSGFGQGRSAAGGHPTENMALNVINGLVKQNIDAQVANREAKGNVYKMYETQLGNSRAAYAATEAHSYAMVQSQLMEIADKSQDPQVKAKAQIANAQISERMANAGQQAAQLSANAKYNQALLTQQQGQQAQAQGRGALIEKYGAQGKLPVQALTQLDEKQKDRVINMGNGSIALANSKEGATEANKALQSTDEMSNTIGELKKGITELGTLDKASPFYTDKAAKLRALAQSVQLMSVKGVEGLNRLNERELEIMQDIVKDPTKLLTRGGANTARLDSLLDTLDTRKGSFIKTYAPGVNYQSTRQLSNQQVK